jgi:hypothetical protein
MTFISFFFSPILPKIGKQDFIYISLYYIHVVLPILKHKLWEFIEHKSLYNIAIYYVCKYMYIA